MSKSFLSKRGFWAAAGERAVKTVAQTAVALIGTTVFFHEVNWALIASAAGLAGVVSVLTSVASGTTDGTPSLAGETLTTE